MIDVLMLIVLLLALVLVGLPAPFAAIATGMTGILSSMPLVSVTPNIGNLAASVFGYETMGVFVLLVLGGWLQELGAVQTFPEKAADDSPDLDRDAWFSGGMLGAPLPLAVSLIFVCTLAEVSIGKTIVAAMIPSLLLTLIYMVLTLFVGRRSSPLRTERGIDVVLLILRILVPIVAMAVAYATVSAGILTPTEAIAVVFVLVAVLAVVGAAISPGGWSRTGTGLMNGAKGVGAYVMYLVGFAALGRGLMISAGDAINTALQGASFAPTIVLLIVVVPALILGMVTGPLAAVGLGAILGLPLASAAGVDHTFLVVSLFLVAEAVRVGPGIWRADFVRERQTNPDGTVQMQVGSWPFYLAAVVVVVMFAAIAPLF